MSFAIGMADSIDDGDAIHQAAQFYAAIANGQSIRSAHLSGQAGLELAGLDDAELPTLAWTETMRGRLAILAFSLVMAGGAASSEPSQAADVESDVPTLGQEPIAGTGAGLGEESLDADEMRDVRLTAQIGRVEVVQHSAMRIAAGRAED